MRNALKQSRFANELATKPKPPMHVPIWFEEHSWPAAVRNRKSRKKPLVESLIGTGWFRRPRR